MPMFFPSGRLYLLSELAPRGMSALWFGLTFLWKHFIGEKQEQANTYLVLCPQNSRNSQTGCMLGTKKRNFFRQMPRKHSLARTNS